MDGGGSLYRCYLDAEYGSALYASCLSIDPGCFTDELVSPNSEPEYRWEEVLEST